MLAVSIVICVSSKPLKIFLEYNWVIASFTTTDSFADVLLDYPHYTRPESYRDKASPPILLSGNHKEIENWKNKKRQEKTQDRRPDLWEKYNKL